MGSRTAIVVGGGLGGMAAATVLAERGVRVTVLERENFLGGRAGSWKDTLFDGTAFQMERGFHGFFRQYYNLRALIRRIDPNLRCLMPLEDYPLLGPSNKQESFAKLPQKSPWNLIELVRRSPSLSLRDLPKIDTKRTLALFSYHPEETYETLDHLSAKDFIDGLNFPKDARALLLDVFSHSFFNPEESYSAAELLMMFHYYFLGNREGLVFDIMREPFATALWEPLEAYLENRQVSIHKETTAHQIDVLDGVRLDQERTSPRYRLRAKKKNGEHCVFEGDQLVLALPVEPLQNLVGSSPSLGDSAWRRQVASLQSTRPFAVWRLWIQQEANPGRAPFAATGGIGLLDNISLYHLFEGESREWARRNRASVVELHAYCIPEQIEEGEVRRDLYDGFLSLYPEFRNAKVSDERFFIRQDCPAFAPGSDALRPRPESNDTTLALAGDFVKLPFPSALMERAASSGFLAANHLLKPYGLPEEPVITPSSKGMLAPFARVLSRTLSRNQNTVLSR